MQFRRRHQSVDDGWPYARMQNKDFPWSTLPSVLLQTLQTGQSLNASYDYVPG